LRAYSACKKLPSRRGASAAGRQSGWSACCGVYLVQQWYGLADEAVEDAFYDSQALRGFAGIELNREPVPDATTVLHFRDWLQKHELTKSLFDEISACWRSADC
jgi:IS5 family transposase